MKNALYLIFLTFLAISCSVDEKSNREKFDNKIENVVVESNEKSAEISDCVFDTNTYKFTTEPIRKYNSQLKFQWDGHNAIVPLEAGDTLILSIGGCNHFGYSAIYKTDGEKFKDSTFLVEKAKWLAQTFFNNGFDKNYVKYISDGKFQLDSDNSSKIQKNYFITDTTMQENEIYEGFRFIKEGNRTEIGIYGYIN